MLPLPKEALCQLLFLLCVAVYINEVRSEGRVVCYYTNWSVYRPGTAKFNPQNINPYLCTHLIYAFGGFTKDNQMKPFDKYQDIEQGGYAKFTGLKTYNKLLKTMIAIGGWNEASSRFSPLVANPERRQKFIKNILKFLRQNHFDGIDLDWEYPAHREGGKQRDKENYAQFVQELRSEFERESEKTGRTRLLLTMAVPAGIEYVEKGYDIPKLNKYLDWFNILTYDFHSSHEPSVNHHAPLYSLEEESEYNYDSELNTDYSVKFYLNAGADRDKIVLGIPTYGRSFTLINEESTDIGAPAEAPGEQGDATREKGYLAYYEICQNIKEDPEWTVVQANPNAVGPYAYRRNQWVGYDDEAIVRKKAQYVVDNSLGGIMFWSIDNDDFRGICTGKPYPLIEAAKDAMLNSLGLGINEVSKSSAPQKPSHSRSRENSSLTRNRITTPEHKLTYAERKGGSKHVQPTPQTIRKRIQSITTSESANIKLTDIEGSSLYVGQRTTTPLPPTTPDPGTDFKCEDEGFFQHPRDCKKYYWCLDSGPSALGIVAHQFTCPSGLYFNPAADSCDFARNVPCKSKKAATAITSTTDRPTSPYNRITAATTRSTKFFRTTPRTTTTTVPPEEENAYDEEHENVHSPFAMPKGFDNGSEEDPKVIKELITLIRKVGGIDELEKHLLRKDDGTISIKEYSASSSSTLGLTTPSSISKSLYEKVLSKPNSLNSFRNNFTTSNILRNIQTTIRDNTHDDENSHSSDIKRSEISDELSKYPFMLSSRNRQGPQSEGLDKSSDFNGFLKEKKKYITISRNRNTKLFSADEEDDDENESFDEMNIKSTSKSFTASSPVYSTIRRTKPLTTFVENVMDKDEKDTKVAGRSTYTSVNRSRAKDITTTELSEVSAAASKRYKHLERSHLTHSSKVPDDSVSPKEEKNYENMVHFPGVDIENTETQKEISTNAQTNFGSVGPKNLINIEEPKRETLATLTTSTKETSLTTPLSLKETNTSDAILVTTNAPLTFITNPTTETLPNAENILKAPTTSHLNETNPDVSEDSSFLSSTPPSIMEYSLYIREPDNNFHLTATETTLYPTTGTIIDTDNLTRTVDSAYKEVNQVSKQRHKGLYNTRTRTFRTTSPKTTGTITNVDIETTPSSAISTNTKKFLIARRQPTLLNSFSQTKITSAVTTTDMPSTSSVETLNDNFLSTVSSPRPFGFPIRRNRPIGTTGVTTEEISIPNDEVIVTKQKHNKINTATKSPNKRYQFQHITTPTAVTELFVEQNGDSDANKTQVRTLATIQSNNIAVTRRPLLSVRRRVIDLSTTATAVSNKQRNKVPTSTMQLANMNHGYIINSTFKLLRTNRPPALKATVVDVTTDVAVTLLNDLKLSPTLKTPLKTQSAAGLKQKYPKIRLSISAAENSSYDTATIHPRRRAPLIKSSVKSQEPTNIAMETINSARPYIDRLENDEASDQVAKSSIHRSRINQINATEHDDDEEQLFASIKKVEKDDKYFTTPPSTTKAPPPELNTKFNYDDIITRRMDSTGALQKPSTLISTIPIFKSPADTKTRAIKKSKRIIKSKPKKTTTSSEELQAAKQRGQLTNQQSLQRTNGSQRNLMVSKSPQHGRIYRPNLDYDYYDDGNARLVGNKSGQQPKVILHGAGIIECLDQGNFPHPLSCRKFISCAKFEASGVVGWEYTCPKGLSYDPVGGMCNWASGLGCKE